MEFEQQDNTLFAIITEKRKVAPRRSNISVLLILCTKDRTRLLEATSRWAVGKASSTEQGIAQELLNRFGEYLHWDTLFHQDGRCRLPTDFAGWERMILQFALWYISHTGSQATLASRCIRWQSNVLPWLSFLQEEGIIPFGVSLPDMRLPNEQGSHGSPQSPKLLGEHPAKPIHDEPVEKAPLDKTIAGPVFWHPDADYLDQVEACLRQRNRILGEALDDYWLRLVRDYRSGRRMLKQLTAKDWQQREQTGKWYDDVYVTRPSSPSCRGSKALRKMSVASLNYPKGHLWALRLMQQQLQHSDKLNCLNPKQLSQHPATLQNFMCDRAATPFAPLIQASALSVEQIALLSMSQLYHRFLGLLNTTDMAVAMALLIREHANLTPDSVAGAQLLNAHGKSYLLLSGDNKSQIFSVDKPRSRSRKYAALTPRAARVLRHLMRATAPVRALLKRVDHPHWRFLFLGIYGAKSQAVTAGHPPKIYAERLYDTEGSFKLSLARCYPALSDAGLGAGTLDFSKIRHTQGVLAWFDKGSIRAVQKRLGNSYRVAIEHYIPEPLLQAWNERIIRRFQNTLLVLAAAEEDYLLEVVDMPNLAELHRFLAQLVYELPAGHSPVAGKVQQHFGSRFHICHTGTGQPKPLEILSDSQLHLRLSPSSLALLLAYRQWAQQHLEPTIQTQPDSLTGLTPQHFIDLAGMLQATAQSNSIGQALRESLEVKKLQRVYSQAESRVPGLVNRLSRLSLQAIDMESIA